MKIYIEASAMMHQRSGIGQYTKRLTEATIKNDKKNRYTAFFFRFYKSRRLLNLPIPPQDNFSYRMIRWLPAVVYYQTFKRLFTVPIDVMLGRTPDVLIFPNFVIWPVINRRTVVIPVIHDLSFIHFSQYSSPQNMHYMKKFVPRTIKRATHIITISENSKRQIIDYYNIDKSKISIVNPAIDHADYYPRTAAEITKIRSKYKLPRQYFLFTGTLEPRKNIQGLLDAYASLDKATQKQYGLVLAGGKGWVDDEIQKRLDDYKSLPIIRTGYVDDEDLPALYSGAFAFVFPSFYEGFGIPPLEAMACGVPVIASNNSSLPEVIGDAGMLLDGTDSNYIANALKKLISDPTLHAQMKKRGLTQASKFSWSKSADDLIELIERLHNEKAGSRS